jgi:hypothetical protein
VGVLTLPVCVLSRGILSANGVHQPVLAGVLGCLK